MFYFRILSDVHLNIFFCGAVLWPLRFISSPSLTSGDQNIFLIILCYNHIANYKCFAISYLTRSLFDKYWVQKVNFHVHIWFHWYLHSWCLECSFVSVKLSTCALSADHSLSKPVALEAQYSFIMGCCQYFLWGLLELSDISNYLTTSTKYYCTPLSSFFCYCCWLTKLLS